MPWGVDHIDLLEIGEDEKTGEVTYDAVRRWSH